MQTPKARHCAKREYKFKFSIQSLPLEIRKPHGRQRGWTVGVRGVVDSRRACPAESTKWGTHVPMETEAASTEPAWGCTRSSVYVLWLLAWCSCGTPNSGSWCVSDFLVCSWDSLSLIEVPCPASIWGLLPCHIMSNFVLFCCCLLEACSLLKRKQRGSRSEGETGWSRAKRSRRRGNCGLEVFYDRIIYFFKPRRKEKSPNQHT